MAEDEKSSKAKFKSKWYRVFREKEEHEQNPKHTNSFKLNEDVSDFLKPSTDRAASTRQPVGPPIDITVAQRWPDAHEVRQASASTPSNDIQQAYSPNGFRKPKRRKGLAVGFVKTAPEIIGCGGDETLDPPSEVGRLKAAMARSVSERRPGTTPGLQWAEQPTVPTQRQPTMQNGDEDDFAPQPLRRAGTSHYETSPPLQKKQASPPVQEERPSMPILSRTPTGFGSQDEQLDHTSTYIDEEQHLVPRIDTRFAWEQSESPSTSTTSAVTSKDGLSATPSDPNIVNARKRELRSGEGMALRRASAMIADESAENELQKRQSLSMGRRPDPKQYETLSRPDAESLMPEVPEPSSARSPNSAASGTGPSPFADPKYIKRHSREVTPGETQLSAPLSLHQQQSSCQQHSREATPQEAQPPPPQSYPQQQPDYHPSYMRTTQQWSKPAPLIPSAVPQVQPPPKWPTENERPTPRNNQSSYVRTVRPPSEESAASRQQPQEPQNMYVARESSGSRERSPMGGGTFRERVAAGPPKPIYSQPNGSSNSLNYFSNSPHQGHSKYFSPSSQQGHSRSSSRDEDSPRQFSAGSGFQPSLPSPRFQTQSQSPQSGSPRSSVVGKPSMLSPYGPGSSPGSQESLTGWKVPQSTRAPSDTLRVQESASRPGSSSSSRSFQRPTNHFSAPRPPQMQQPEPRNVSKQQEEVMQPVEIDGSVPQQQRSPDYGSTQKSQVQPPAAKTAASNLRSKETLRSGPAGTTATSQRPAISPMPTSEGNPAADAAYADFAARVAHMKGVFKLTAEKERPSDRCTPQTWLRTGIWWYLKGKAGLELLLQQRPRSNDGQPRELLTQPHVDLAKTWWILTDPLETYNIPEEISPRSAQSPSGGPEFMSKQSVATLKSHIKSLSLSLSRNQLMPPPQSLIQGQDTRIWLEYPRFTADAAAVLSGTASQSYILEEFKNNMQPLEALPINDTQDVFCYGRFPVEAAIHTDDANTDRVIMPCILTMLRGKQDFLTSIVIASQSELVSIKVAPNRGNDGGLTWHDVAWKASSLGLIIRLPRGFDLSMRMQEKDYRSLWNLVEYARKVEHNLRAGPDEQMVHSAQLAELQYADSSDVNSFPTDKMRRCTALVFERTVSVADSGGQRRFHRGYRILLVTDPDHKSLAHASHEVCKRGPLYFEFITDAAAHGMAAMVVRIRDEARQCRILLVFADIASRQDFYDVLNGLSVSPEETIVGKMNLASINIEAATQVEGFTQSAHPALRSLQWHKLGITNGIPEDDYERKSLTVESENLRILARHSTGCITDRLNLSKGELLLRLPCANSASIQLLRNPQEDISMSIDTRHSQAPVVDGVSELMRTVQSQSTIRTFTFASHEDLHAFQTAITGLTVRYDGLASALSIARRRMVVPIYKKWEASNVRLQLVSHSNVVQLLAFMEGFSHADAMCFQVKSTDVFETVKGDGKWKKWAVRMVDAKFSLPHQQHQEKGESEISSEEKVRMRFVNLEMLEYAEEHDDITVGFETQEGKLSFSSSSLTSLLKLTATRSRPIRTSSSCCCNGWTRHYAEATHLNRLPSLLSFLFGFLQGARSVLNDLDIDLFTWHSERRFRWSLQPAEIGRSGARPLVAGLNVG